METFSVLFVRGFRRSPVDSPWPVDSHTKASDAELWCFLWSAPEQKVHCQSRRRWFESRSLWGHCNARTEKLECFVLCHDKKYRVRNFVSWIYRGCIAMTANKWVSVTSSDLHFVLFAPSNRKKNPQKSLYIVSGEVLRQIICGVCTLCYVLIVQRAGLLIWVWRHLRLYYCDWNIRFT